jgi:glucose-fructose oxidoreductase
VKTIFALALFLSSIVACAQDGNTVSGQWRVHSTFSGYQTDTLCALNQRGSKLTGTCTSEDGKHQLEGLNDGAKLSWFYETEHSGIKTTVRFTGSLDLATSKISGSVNVPQFDTDGTFTATPATVLVASPAYSGAPLRVAIVGLVHGHVAGLLHSLPEHADVLLVGISERDTNLASRYAKQFHLSQKLFFTNAATMLTAVHPDAVLVYTDILDHRKVIELAAAHGVSSMVEKPLATNVQDALMIRKVARKYGVHVLVNYETTWYPSNSEVFRDVRRDRLGAIRRVEFHDGHKGPKDMHVGPEFLKWLTDPRKSGGGVIFDFGCYGADLMTVFMHGETPLSVTAVALTEQPDNYPAVRDDATIILHYPTAEAVIEPSWNWTFARKDMSVYGTKGNEVAVNADQIIERFTNDAAEIAVKAKPLTGHDVDSLEYLKDVIAGQVPDNGQLSSLDTNVIVVQILAAARESAKTGHTVLLGRLEPNKSF